MHFVSKYLHRSMIRGGALSHGLHVRVDKTSNLHTVFVQEDISQRCYQTQGHPGFKQHNSCSYAELGMEVFIREKLHCYILDLI